MSHRHTGRRAMALEPTTKLHHWVRFHQVNESKVVNRLLVRGYDETNYQGNANRNA